MNERQPSAGGEPRHGEADVMPEHVRNPLPWLIRNLQRKQIEQGDDSSKSSGATESSQ